MTTETGPVRFPWGLTVLTVPALVLLVSLGIWQVNRLQWKEGLIARAQASADLPPVDLAILGTLPEPEFRTAVLPCDFQNQPFIELQTIHDGEPGVRLIAACRGWLVDLGFVAGTVSARPVREPAAIPGVVAQARRTDPPPSMTPPPQDGRFYGRDMPAMARALSVTGPVPPYTLYAQGSVWPRWEAISPGAPPVAFANNHLGYALTWFGLAIALAGFYIALIMRRLKS